MSLYVLGATLFEGKKMPILEIYVDITSRFGFASECKVGLRG